MAVQTASHARSVSHALLRRDVLLDAGVALTVLAITLTAGPRAQLHDFDALGVVLASLASLALVARRRAPLAVFALTATASATLIALGYADAPPGPVVAVYFLALAQEDARARTWLTDAALAGLFLLQVAAFERAQHAGYPGVPPFPFTLLFWVAAWVVGDRVRQRRERIAWLERDRRLAAAEERARIARDLHDSAAHAINVILVQAGAARLLQERDPDRARAALETIEDVARETIGEIDQLVRALREDQAGAEVEPPPGLAALDTLAARHRAAGRSLTIAVHGARRALAPAVDRASYRILQEALTNAARHGGDGATVEVAYGPDALELRVTNPLRDGRIAVGAGHGIVGMRERAALLGGSLEAQASDGVFRVRALLPYRGERT
jgi:signal transduction histidine kinase